MLALTKKHIVFTVHFCWHHTSRNSNGEKVQLKVYDMTEEAIVSKYLEIEFQSKKIKYEERFELNVFLEWRKLPKQEEGVYNLIASWEELLYSAMLR